MTGASLVCKQEMSFIGRWHTLDGVCVCRGLCAQRSTSGAKAQRGATGEGGTAGVRENVRESCRNSERLLGVEQKNF